MATRVCVCAAGVSGHRRFPAGPAAFPARKNAGGVTERGQRARQGQPLQEEPALPEALPEKGGEESAGFHRVSGE